MSNHTISDEVRARRAWARPAGGTAHGVVDLHRLLLETAGELTAEFSELPAGSVMRCFGRSVKLARAQGVTGTALPEAARRIARASLRDRVAGGRPGWAALAATASVRCSGFVTPTMGEVTARCAISQASATWAAGTPRRSATSSTFATTAASSSR